MRFDQQARCVDIVVSNAVHMHSSHSIITVLAWVPVAYSHIYTAARDATLMYKVLADCTCAVTPSNAKYRDRTRLPNNYPRIDWLSVRCLKKNCHNIGIIVQWPNPKYISSPLSSGQLLAFSWSANQVEWILAFFCVVVMLNWSCNIQTRGYYPTTAALPSVGNHPGPACLRQQLVRAAVPSFTRGRLNTLPTHAHTHRHTPHCNLSEWLATDGSSRHLGRSSTDRQTKGVWGK